MNNLQQQNVCMCVCVCACCEGGREEREKLTYSSCALVLKLIWLILPFFLKGEKKTISANP